MTTLAQMSRFTNRAAPRPGSSTPTYGDIFNYLDPRMEGAHAPGGWATPTQGDIIGYHTEQRGSGEGGSVDVQVPDYAQTYTIDQSKLPDKYKGLVANYNPASGGSQGDVQYDLSKLPNQGNTALGNITQMYSLGAGKNPMMSQSFGGRPSDTEYVSDRSKVGYDPNYGWLTPRMNMTHPEEKETGLFGAIDKYGMPAALGVASLFGGPQFALGIQAFNAAKGAISGEPWKNIAMSALPGLVGAGIGGLGGVGEWQLPPGVGDALNYAKSGYGLFNAAKNRNPVSGGLTLAHMFGFGG